MTTEISKNRDSFIFYRSFFEAISDLPKKNKLEVFEAVSDFSLNFTEPNLSGLSKTIFTLIRPQLEANNRRFINGCKGAQHGEKGADHGKKGGRPPNNKPPKNTPNNPPQNPPNKNENDNDNDNIKNTKKEKDQFDQFWQKYGKKISKADAEKKFKAALKKSSFDEIMQGLDRYIAARDENHQFWKNPSTWLHQECWNDEYLPRAASPPRYAKSSYSPADACKGAIQLAEQKYQL